MRDLQLLGKMRRMDSPVGEGMSISKKVGLPPSKIIRVEGAFICGSISTSAQIIVLVGSGDAYA